MMHFIFILRVDLVGNWLLYSISEEMSSNLTRFLNLFDNFFSGLTRIEPMHKCTCIMVLPCEAGVLTVLPSWDGRRKGQACKVLLPTHDAFHFYIASRFGWQLVIIYSISEEMSSNLTRFLNLFDKFFSGLTRIRTHAQVVHASWCCLARRAC